jgi:hypothetical protein
VRKFLLVALFILPIQVFAGGETGGGGPTENQYRGGAPNSPDSAGTIADVICQAVYGTKATAGGRYAARVCQDTSFLSLAANPNDENFPAEMLPEILVRCQIQCSTRYYRQSF